MPESLFFALLFSQFLRGVEINLSSIRASTSVTFPAIKFEALSNDSPREMRKWFGMLKTNVGFFNLFFFYPVNFSFLLPFLSFPSVLS